jgi:hypothetical protein
LAVKLRSNDVEEGITGYSFAARLLIIGTRIWAMGIDFFTLIQGTKFFIS